MHLHLMVEDNSETGSIAWSDKIKIGSRYGASSLIIFELEKNSRTPDIRSYLLPPLDAKITK